jgi:hypothetical protein
VGLEALQLGGSVIYGDNNFSYSKLPVQLSTVA